MSKIEFDKNEQYKILDCAKYINNPSNDVGLADGADRKAIAFYRITDRLQGFFDDNVARETCPPYCTDFEKMGIEDNKTLDSIRDVIKAAFRHGYYAGMIDNNEHWKNEE